MGVGSKPVRGRVMLAATVALLVGISGAVAFIAYRGRAQVCARSAERLGTVWDEDRRSQVQSAVADAASWAELERRLDQHAAAWITVHRQACEATESRGAIPLTSFDPRMSCLNQRLAELGAFVDVLSQADDAIVEHALVAELDPPASCMSLGVGEHPVASPTPAVATQVAEARKMVADVKALRLLGQSDQALARAEQVAQHASSLGFMPLTVMALLELGLVQQAAGRSAQARATLGRARDQAVGAGETDVAARASVALDELNAPAQRPR